MQARTVGTVPPTARKVGIAALSLTAVATLGCATDSERPPPRYHQLPDVSGSA